MANTCTAPATNVNGFKPIAVDDIDHLAEVSCEQSEAIAALFRAIERLTDDQDIKTLCNHGALQATLQGDCIDSLRERAVEGGLIQEEPHA